MASLVWLDVDPDAIASSTKSQLAAFVEANDGTLPGPRALKAEYVAAAEALAAAAAAGGDRGEDQGDDGGADGSVGRHWSLGLFVGLCMAPVVGALTQVSLPAAYWTVLMHAFGLSVVGFGLVVAVIPGIASKLCDRGLYGIDINKFDRSAPGVDMSTRPRVPEALGLVVGIVFMVCVVLFEVDIRFLLHDASEASAGIAVGDYNAALHSICFMLLLGFADDVLDLRWRYKLFLPAVATLPLLVAYSGPTAVVVPVPLRAWLGPLVELGLLYTLYMGLLAIFTTNAINILAGVNGLEAGQSLVIAASILTHNVIEMSQPEPSAEPEYHLFSMTLMLPFFAVTCALLVFNWFPSRVFVGDTYTYFAGMSFAVVAILCHFSKTLMLFFLPQILNFVLSLWQILFGPILFGVKCPRHRLAHYNPRTKLLECVPAHHNLLNLYLWFSGPLSERALTNHLMVFQAACSLLGFAIRYYVAAIYYT